MAGASSQTLTILISTSTSTAFDARSMAAFGLQMPSAFTGTTITFTVSADGGTTYQALYDITNTQVSMTVAASRSYDLPAELTTWTHFKIVSGSSEAAARSLVVIGKKP